MGLRGTAEMLCGKNTMIKKALKDRAEAGGEVEKNLFTKLEPLMVGNIGLIFTNGELSDVVDLISKHRIQAPARAGVLAPVSVTVPAGNTFLEPTKTSFFQALGINTKITKGTVEILKDEQVVQEGTRVGSSEAALLALLKLKPFWYGLEIENVYDNGTVMSAAVLAITDADMKEKVLAGISNVTALSLGLGIPTQASFPHTVINAFKNALAISVMTDYDFDEFNGKELKAKLQ
eukprot:NODE_3468_length_888_cov_157.287779_g3446_i0.p1 GENE.NODE_3468_length_888_cov_157.287779_g3446_i0~~NODE_3468_length_888_cov_157.287779_g3446_i0.p1  ORF type:complete len:268 (+),score=98.39 NODE_3468_length_888_cov_157.287779_g3446_i0:104-805(+)